MVDKVANLEIWTFILSVCVVYKTSSILPDYVWLDFLKISGKSGIWPNSKNHYLVHPHSKYPENNVLYCNADL